MSIIEKAFCKDCQGELDIEYRHVSYDGELVIGIPLCGECTANTEDEKELSRIEGFDEAKVEIIDELKCLEVRSGSKIKDSIDELIERIARLEG